MKGGTDQEVYTDMNNLEEQLNEAKTQIMVLEMQIEAVNKTIRGLRSAGFSSGTSNEYDTDEAISIHSECENERIPTETSTFAVEQLEVELKRVKERLTTREIQLEWKEDELKKLKNDDKKARIGHKRHCCLFPIVKKKKSNKKESSAPLVTRTMG